jgi:hypothetical protein
MRSVIASLSFLAERIHVLDHSGALFGIGQPPASSGEIIDHMLDLVGARYDNSHGRMGKDELKKELAPAGALEIGRPIRKALAQGFAK